MVDIGTLRHRVRLERPVSTRDDNRAPVTTWDHVATVWASIWPVRGREYWAAKSINAEVEVTIRVRYRGDIGPDWRLVYRDKVYAVLAVMNLRGEDAVLELQCKEVGRDG